MAVYNKQHMHELVANFWSEHQEQGKSYTLNSFKELGVPRSTVYRIINKFQTHRSVKRLPGSGRPCKRMNLAKQRQLVRAASNKVGVSQRKYWGTGGI